MPRLSLPKRIFVCRFAGDATLMPPAVPPRAPELYVGDKGVPVIEFEPPGERIEDGDVGSASDLLEEASAPSQPRLRPESGGRLLAGGGGGSSEAPLPVDGMALAL
mmetsp:Transcript_40177/g.87800  ORF Transcript_40177/g.87800 Transcript_40177/m.87800 type:complete len:106 (+) Transcript_40177:2591-2908(+)